MSLDPEPTNTIAAKQTTTITASMTAYSTAVGPSSRFTKLTIDSVNLRMVFSYDLEKVLHGLIAQEDSGLALASVALAIPVVSVAMVPVVPLFPFVLPLCVPVPF